MLGRISGVFVVSLLLSYFFLFSAMSIYSTPVDKPLQKKEKVEPLENKSLNDLKNFLRKNKLDDKKYTSDYNCVDFSKKFQETSESYGFETGYLYIEYNRSGHMLNSIQLENQTVFVEPQTDKIYQNITEYQEETEKKVVDNATLW